MKLPSSRSARGFTLIELLIVIAIVAVLASAAFVAGKAAIERAKRTTAMATATAIESAVDNFFTEYGTLPTEDVTDGETDAAPLNTRDDLDLLNVLLGMEDPDSAKLMNTRGINFLKVKEGKRKGNNGGTDGLVYSNDGKTVIGLFDPWGGPYYVLLDTGFDEKLTAKTAAAGVAKTLNRKIVVWSNGADNTTGTPGKGKTIDDVKTWN